MMSLPIWIFVILLLPWAIIALGIVSMIVCGIVRVIADNHIEKKNKKEADKYKDCPDYMEGPNENL